MPELRRLRPRGRVTLVAIGALAALVALAAAATFTPLFAADEVRIEGLARLTAADVRRLGAVEVGVNVFHLDATAVERRLLGDRRIARATVERELPDAIVVRIVERIPVGRTVVGGDEVAVADDGEILPGAAPATLPKIRALAGELDVERRIHAAKVLASLAPSVRRAIATVHVDADARLVLQVHPKLVVTYGAAADVQAKADALRAVLAWADEKGIDLREIDVTVPTVPTARTVEGSVAPS